MGDSPPVGWRYATLGELAEVVSGGTPSRAVAEYWGGSIPWATPTEVSGANVRYLHSTRESLTEAGVGAAGLRVLPVDSILVTTRATIGAVARTRVPMTTNQGFQNLVPHADTDASWLFHAIETARPALHSLAAGSTFREVSRESFRRLRLLVAPPREQRAIAAVLDAIDETIERACAVIVVIETLRQSLLHSLLTRGLPGSHTEWKSVPGVGSVPACWAVMPLTNAITEMRYGTSRPLSAERRDGGHVVLRIPNVARGVADFSDLRYATLPKREAEALTLQPGDLLIVRTNGNPAICGQSVVFDQLRGQWAFASYLLRLRTDASLLDPNYLWMFLQSQAGRSQLARIIRTSAGNYNLSASGLAALNLALPPVAEQARIIEVSRYQAEVLALARDELECLRKFSKAVADALLTGRVRLNSQLSLNGSDRRSQPLLTGSVL